MSETPPVSKLTPAALALAMLGCIGPARVELVHHPGTRRPLDAVGVHSLRYAVEVEDERPGNDPMLVGERPSLPFWPGRVTSTVTAAAAVKGAVENELRSRDLRVTTPDACDVLVRVILQHFFCTAHSDEIYALVEADVEVLDSRGTPMLLDLFVEARAEQPVVVLFSALRYEAALNAALGDFAARLVRHPDFLIAAQKIWGTQPRR